MHVRTSFSRLGYVIAHHYNFPLAFQLNFCLEKDPCLFSRLEHYNSFSGFCFWIATNVTSKTNVLGSDMYCRRLEIFKYTLAMNRANTNCLTYNDHLRKEIVTNYNRVL